MITRWPLGDKVASLRALAQPLPAIDSHFRAEDGRSCGTAPRSNARALRHPDTDPSLPSVQQLFSSAVLQCSHDCLCLCLCGRDSLWARIRCGVMPRLASRSWWQVHGWLGDDAPRASAIVLGVCLGVVLLEIFPGVGLCRILVVVMVGAVVGSSARVAHALRYLFGGLASRRKSTYMMSV